MRTPDIFPSRPDVPNGRSRYTQRRNELSRQQAYREEDDLYWRQHVAKTKEELKTELFGMFLEHSTEEVKFAADAVRECPAVAPFVKQLLQLQHEGRMRDLYRFQQL
jgi:hypothetical protein